MQLLQSSPRYWPGIDGNFILEEWGRWRLRHTLEWLLAHGFDTAPDCIRLELMKQCWNQWTDVKGEGDPDPLSLAITGRGPDDTTQRLLKWQKFALLSGAIFWWECLDELMHNLYFANTVSPGFFKTDFRSFRGSMQCKSNELLKAEWWNVSQCVLLIVSWSCS